MSQVRKAARRLSGGASARLAEAASAMGSPIPRSTRASRFTEIYLFLDLVDFPAAVVH